MRHKRWAIVIYVIGLMFVVNSILKPGTMLQMGAFLMLCTLGDIRWASPKKAS
jgi:hypothetical protein